MTTTTNTLSISGITIRELLDSVTGFDEIAVRKHWDLELFADAQDRPMDLVRACVAVHLKHTGAAGNDTEARQAALAMATREVKNYFSDEPDDPEPVAPGEPLSPAGNVGGAHAASPTN